MLALNSPSHSHRKSRAGTTFALCSFIVIYAVARILQVFPSHLPMLAVVILHVAPPALFAFLHGALRYGLRNISVFFALCLAVGFASEVVGVLTGFPFGPYYFAGLMGPKIFGVPVFLGLAYTGMGYLSWTLAMLILGEDSADSLAESKNILTAPLIASFIMVAWDLAMEPVWSTVLRAWTWTTGGPYFGVPLSNFLGWYLTVYIFFQLFALYLRKRSATTRSLPLGYWHLAILFYAVSASGNLLLLLPLRGPALVFDPTGASWQVASIIAATALVSILVMGAFAFVAWARLLDQETK
jgi:uncharacterized membrane protein